MYYLTHQFNHKQHEKNLNNLRIKIFTNSLKTIRNLNNDKNNNNHIESRRKLQQLKYSSPTVINKT